MNIPLRQLWFWIALIAWTACLAGGFLISRLGVMVFFTAILAILWSMGGGALPEKYSLPWFPPVGLAFSVGLAALGILLHAPLVLMLLAATFSLACWDLAGLNLAFFGAHSQASNSLFEQKRLRALGLVVAAGILTAGASQALRMQIPFGWIVLIILSAVFGLDRVVQAIKSGKDVAS